MSDLKINIRLLSGVLGGLLGGMANIFIPGDMFPLFPAPFLAVLVIIALALSLIRSLLPRGVKPHRQLYIPFYILAAALADSFIIGGGNVLLYAVTFFFIANETIGIIQKNPSTANDPSTF